MHLTWKARDGTIREDFHNTEALEAIPSPDGRLITLTQRDRQMATIKHAIFDRARRTITSFTPPDTTSTSPIWSPDSRRVVYPSVRNGADHLDIRETRPGGADSLLLHTDGTGAQSWSPDGNAILFNAVDPKTRLDQWAIEARSGAAPKVFVGGEADQCCGRFSPDGEWVAYVSNESGRPEVFVTPVGGGADPTRASMTAVGA